MYSRSKLDELARDGFIVSGATGKPFIKDYVGPDPEIELDNIWDDIAPRRYEISRKLPSQRPLLMVERLVRMTTDVGDLVVDPFCGSGTALEAASKLGRLWIGGDISSTSTFASDKRLSARANFQKLEQEDLQSFQRFPTNVEFSAPFPTFVQPIKLELHSVAPAEETLHTEYKEILGKNAVASIASTADQYVIAFLNSNGGNIYWGIRDSDYSIVGVNLMQDEKDELRRLITESLHKAQPGITPGMYHLALYELEHKGSPVPNKYVVRISVPMQRFPNLFFTSGNLCYVKTEAGKVKLNGPQIENEVRRRLAEHLAP